MLKQLSHFLKGLNLVCYSNFCITESTSVYLSLSLRSDTHSLWWSLPFYHTSKISFLAVNYPFIRLIVPYSCNFVISVTVWFLSLAWNLIDKIHARKSPGRDTLITTLLLLRPESIVNGNIRLGIHGTQWHQNQMITNGWLFANRGMCLAAQVAAALDPEGSKGRGKNGGRHFWVEWNLCRQNEKLRSLNAWLSCLPNEICCY